MSNNENDIFDDYIDDCLLDFDKHICCCCETNARLYLSGYGGLSTMQDANPCPFAFVFRCVGMYKDRQNDGFHFELHPDSKDTNSSFVYNDLGEIVFNTCDNGGGYDVIECRAFKEATGMRKLFEEAIKEKDEAEKMVSEITEELPFD